MANLSQLILSLLFPASFIIYPSGRILLSVWLKGQTGGGETSAEAATPKLTADFLRAPTAMLLDAVAVATDAKQPARGTLDPGGESGQGWGGRGVGGCTA